ncbi:MAG: alanine--glyoxylate aminotransferase family protein [Bradymonadaceae bacterium]|nr:alanine--glyoxylate aminotransferase family protein [Lujinxingiaceae bacterium]
MQKQFLIAPGPTPVPEEARLAMARELMHHRGPVFKRLFGEVRKQLQWLFETQEEVLTLTCSGTGAFEAAIINFTRREDTLIAIGGGKFGERWGKIAGAYGMKVVTLDIPWGQTAKPEALRDLLAAHPECAMVTLSASETSTGTYHPVEELAAVVRAHGRALFAVDGITAVGVHRLPMDAWGIDVLVSGSQKAFGIPPGLGFVAANARAWERYESSNHPKYYFDLGRERTNHVQNQTAFTPAISLVVALHEVMKLMQTEGLEALIERHRLNACAAQAGVQALGCRLYPEVASYSTTAAVVPEGVDAQQVVRAMRDRYGVTIAGGQDHLASSVFRIGHIGFIDRSDMLIAISALEFALRDAGAKIEIGAGLRAVQNVYAQPVGQ